MPAPGTLVDAPTCVGVLAKRAGTTAACVLTLPERVEQIGQRQLLPEVGNVLMRFHEWKISVELSFANSGIGFQNHAITAAAMQTGKWREQRCSDGGDVVCE